MVDSVSYNQHSVNHQPNSSFLPFVPLTEEPYEEARDEYYEDSVELLEEVSSEEEEELERLTEAEQSLEEKVEEVVEEAVGFSFREETWALPGNSQPPLHSPATGRPESVNSDG